MSSEKPTEFPSQVINGWSFPAQFDAHHIRDTIEMKVRDDDLIVSTYPKCGTTWLEYIIWSIHANGQLPLPDEPTKNKLSPYLEMMGPSTAESLPSPRNMKVHMPYHLTPKNPTAKYIIVNRNPRDCLVSYYHFLRTKHDPDLYSEVTFNHVFEQFVSGDIPYGDYFDHLLGWYEHRDDPNILFMLYEDMLADPSAAVLKVGKFMGNDYETKLTANNNELLNKVVENTSFGYMKSTIKMIDRNKSSNFFRKGVSGDWVNYFSEDQVKRLDERMEEKGCRQLMATLWPHIF